MLIVLKQDGGDGCIAYVIILKTTELKHILQEIVGINFISLYRHISDTLWVWVLTVAIKQGLQVIIYLLVEGLAFNCKKGNI